MCVCFGRGSLHCFTSCTPGIINGPISCRCMGVASRWNYNGDCMIKIFLGAGVVTPSKPPSEQFSSLPAFTSFTAAPLLIHHPFSPHKNVDHTLGCSAFYGVYNGSRMCHVLVSIKKCWRTAQKLYFIHMSDPCTFSIST